MQRDWETARYISLNVMSTQIKQGTIRNLMAQMRFPWEKEKKGPEFKGNVDEVLAKWDKIPFQKQ